MYKLISDYTLSSIIHDYKIKKLIGYVDKKRKKALETILPFVDIKISFYVNEIFDSSDERSVYDLMLEDYDSIMVIVGRDDFASAKALLEGMGLRYGVNFKNLERYSEENWTAQYPFDPILGCTPYDSKDKRYIGYKVFDYLDNIDENVPLRILTLGGSTTDAYLYPWKSWSESLYEELNKKEICCEVFCGGVAGYNSGQELFKLIRDGSIINPDIVICYTGFNDCFLHKNPYIPSYTKEICDVISKNDSLKMFYSTERINITYGCNDERFTECAESFYNYWIRNQIMIHSICQGMGVKHITVLQPMLLYGEKRLSEFEKEYIANLVYISYEKYKKEDVIIRFNQFNDLAKMDCDRFDWMYDFTDIFKDTEGVYIDLCHVNEYGGMVIAESIIRCAF